MSYIYIYPVIYFPPKKKRGKRGDPILMRLRSGLTYLVSKRPEVVDFTRTGFNGGFVIRLRMEVKIGE